MKYDREDIKLNAAYQRGQCEHFLGVVTGTAALLICANKLGFFLPRGGTQTGRLLYKSQTSIRCGVEIQRLS